MEITKGEQKRANISFLSDSHKTRGNPFPLLVQSAAKCGAVIGLVSLPAARDSKECNHVIYVNLAFKPKKRSNFGKDFCCCREGFVSSNVYALYEVLLGEITT